PPSTRGSFVPERSAGCYATSTCDSSRRRARPTPRSRLRHPRQQVPQVLPAGREHVDVLHHLLADRLDVVLLPRRDQQDGSAAHATNPSSADSSPAASRNARDSGDRGSDGIDAVVPTRARAATRSVSWNTGVAMALIPSWTREFTAIPAARIWASSRSDVQA